jgi:Ca2+-binding RTX toxin-like protein
MDASGLEHVALRLLGGADTLTVDSLAGTGVRSVDADLQGTGGVGDGAADRVVVNGTAGADAVHVGDTAGAVDVTGLAAEVTVDNVEPAIDAVALHTLGGADAVTVDDLAAPGFGRVEVDPGGADGQRDSVVVNGTAGDDQIGLTGDATTESVFAGAGLVAVSSTDAQDVLDVQALDGNDQIAASSDPGGAMSLVLDGGAGDDFIVGSQGVDTLLGGDGNDLVDGNRGNDVALLGAGDDTFQWDPGDASDTVEGQDGTDTLQFNGANIGERIELSANGPRLRLTRDIATVTMDAAGIEQANVRALGGSDTVTVDDLTGTGVTGVGIDLGGFGGGGDAAADSVVANATDAADSIDVSGDAGAATVSGTPARIDIANAEPGSDALTVNGLGGDDAITAGNLSAATIGLIETGGDGNDVLVGGAGNDSLFGNDGDDVLIGGPGLDLLDGGSGNNVLIQD